MVEVVAEVELVEVERDEELRPAGREGGSAEEGDCEVWAGVCISRGRFCEEI